MIKVKVNDKCPCDSGKKYKKCCMSSDQEYKSIHNDELSTGHEISSDTVQAVIDKLLEEYLDHKIIDVSNVLTDDTYKAIQTKNYFEKTIMVAEKNINSNGVFATRGPGNVDIMVMYRGAYQCFEYGDVELAFRKVVNMIDTRLSGKDM